MKKFFAVVLSLAMILALSACGASQPAASSAAPSSTAPAESAPAEKTWDKPEYDLTFATSYASTMFMTEYCKQFCDDVFEMSKGRIKVTYYGDGQLGSENDTNTALGLGDVDLVMGGYMASMVPEYAFIAAPYLMKSFDHLKNIVNSSELGDGMKAAFEKVGIHILGFGNRGPRQMALNKEIKSISDFAGVKIRVPQRNQWVASFTAMGFEPMAIDMSELYTAIQTGLCNAGEGVYDQILSYSLNETCQYLIESNHMYDMSMFSINNGVWESMDDECREIINTCAQKALDGISQEAAEANAAAKKTLLDKGMKEIVLSEEDKTALREMCGKAYESFFKDTWTVTNFEQIMSIDG